jgi:ATP-dependent helicase/DNAse subunit B
MPLTLVLGPANSARAGEILGAYTAAAPRGALLVVPTAADALHYDRELAGRGVALGRTLTFGGLIAEIERRVGSVAPRITPLARRLLLARVIAGARLEALHGPAATPGFAAALGRLFGEFRTARITPPRLLAGVHGQGRLGEELAGLYRRYDERLAAAGLADGEQAAWAALDALRARPAAWGAAPVFFYGFDDLTEIELDAIRTLAGPAAAAVTVSLAYEAGRTALRARAGAVEELRGQADLVRELPALDTYYAPPARAALHALERRLFQPGAPPVEPGDAVRLLEAGGERAEAELIAAEVLAALRAGVPAEELVVVVRSLAARGALLERSLARHGVPVTSPRTVPLGHTPLGRAALALLRAATDPGATADDVLSFLRHPLAAAPQPAVDVLARTVRRLGLRTAAQALAVATSEHLPVHPVTELRASAVIAGDFASSLRRWLAPDTTDLDARSSAMILEACQEVPDASPGELLELLEAIEVPVHTGGRTGAVLVAEPAAIRARRFRRVYVTGLCEGEFPALAGGEQIFGDEPRRELARRTGIVLPIVTDRLDRERYLLYAVVSRATEQVLCSYRSSDEDGSVVAPSPFLDDLAALFPDGWRERRRRRLLSDPVWEPQDAPTEREHALALAAAHPGAGPVSPAPGPQTRRLGAEALRFVRHTERVSAGALEQFAACPVAWLVERQLQPDALEPDGPALVRGTLLHAVLERVFRALDGPLTPERLADAEAALAAELRVLPPEIAPGEPAAVREAVRRRIVADLRRYLRHEAGEGGTWAPRHLEYEFTTTLGPVAVTGVIDRIDVSPDGRRAIVRDYKTSGGQDRAAARWIEGTVLQAGLYMLVARRLLGLEPVAGLYQPLTGRELRPRGAFLTGTPVGASAYATDGMSAEELDELLGQVEATALQIAATIARGELTPCPQTCSRDGCRHPGICWA